MTCTHQLIIKKKRKYKIYHNFELNITSILLRKRFNNMDGILERLMLIFMRNNWKQSGQNISSKKKLLSLKAFTIFIKYPLFNRICKYTMFSVIHSFIYSLKPELDPTIDPKDTGKLVYDPNACNKLQISSRFSFSFHFLYISLGFLFCIQATPCVSSIYYFILGHLFFSTE